MLHKPDNIVKEWWGVQLIQVRWNLNWSLAWVLRKHFLSSFLNCSAKWEFRHNSNTVNCFNFFMIGCQTRTEGTVKVFGLLIKFSYLMQTSVARSVIFPHENNPVLFWVKRKLIEFTAPYLNMQSVKNTCVHINCFPFVPRQKTDRDLLSCYQM